MKETKCFSMNRQNSGQLRIIVLLCRMKLVNEAGRQSFTGYQAPLRMEWKENDVLTLKMWPNGLLNTHGRERIRFTILGKVVPDKIRTPPVQSPKSEIWLLNNDGLSLSVWVGFKNILFSSSLVLVIVLVVRGNEN